MPDPLFDELQSTLEAAGAEAMLAALIDRLRASRQYHELFDAQLMQSRLRLGLPLVQTGSLDDLEEPLRSRVEESYLEACRDVGSRLLAEGRLREAWMYLRPVGEKQAVAEALARTEPSDENIQDLIEIALHEGIAPALGYRLVLERYGTCNAISTFEGALGNKSRADQQEAASLLVRHLYGELKGNLKADIARREQKAPESDSIGELLAGRDWLFADNNYHIDTTHLAATVRIARLLEDRETVRLALELTEYGRRLGEQFQMPGEEPFVELYPAHRRFFQVMVGEDVDGGLEYFLKRATTSDIEEHGTLPAECYIVLLARLGRKVEAVEAAATLIPPGTRTTGFAPGLMELSRRAGDFSRALEMCRRRGDLVSYAAGLVESRLDGQS